MTAKKRQRSKVGSLEQTIKFGLRKALPTLVVEMSDILEKRPPRLTKKAKRELESGIDQYVDECVPLITDLEKLEGDPTKLPEAYQRVEGLLRTSLKGTEIKIKPGEDAFDSYLREFKTLVRMPSAAKRISQPRRVREGIEQLIEQLVSNAETENQAILLIEEFGRRHGRQYMRYLHGSEARHKTHRKLALNRMTSKNITILTEEYRDAAAAFEKRLRLIVGLNYIAMGTPKTYAELRRQGYNDLLQIVSSLKNPRLHFLRGVIDRNVRNALAHDGASPSFSKKVIRFVDYSPAKGIETEVTWTMSKFLRNTTRLVQTVFTATCLEPLLNYACLNKSVAGFRNLVRLSESLKKA
jgi:hypothetical protein